MSLQRSEWWESSSEWASIVEVAHSRSFSAARSAKLFEPEPKPTKTNRGFDALILVFVDDYTSTCLVVLKSPVKKRPSMNFLDLSWRRIRFWFRDVEKIETLRVAVTVRGISMSWKMLLFLANQTPNWWSRGDFSYFLQGTVATSWTMPRSYFLLPRQSFYLTASLPPPNFFVSWQFRNRCLTVQYTKYGGNIIFQRF